MKQLILKSNHIVLSMVAVLFSSLLNAQNFTFDSINWQRIDDGFSFCEIDAPLKSPINNSKLFIVKIDPKLYEFNLLSASQYENKARTSPE